MKDFEEEIRAVLFDLGKDVKVHRIDSQNSVIEIDYDKYVEKFKSILGEYNHTPETLE